VSDNLDWEQFQEDVRALTLEERAQMLAEFNAERDRLLVIKAKLEEEIANEQPSFDVSQMLAWVDGHESPDSAIIAARERLDIQPLIWKRAAELAETARHQMGLTADVDFSSILKLREKAIQSLWRELKEVCFVAIDPHETRRRFLEAWDSQWPSGT
jgi:hypothetical protein